MQKDEIARGNGSTWNFDNITWDKICGAHLSRASESLWSSIKVTVTVDLSFEMGVSVEVSVIFLNGDETDQKGQDGNDEKN